MAGQQLPPFLEIEEGAPRESLKAFADLTALVIQQPENAPAVFATLGKTPEQIIQTAEGIGRPHPDKKATAEDLRYRLDIARACGAILREEMDDEANLGPRIDDEMRRAARDRRTDRHQLRVIRLGAYISHTGQWALTLPGEAIASEAA